MHVGLLKSGCKIACTACMLESSSHTELAPKIMLALEDPFIKGMSCEMEKRRAKEARFSPCASTYSDALSAAWRSPSGAGCQSPRAPTGTPPDRSKPMPNGLDEKMWSTPAACRWRNHSFASLVFWSVSCAQF